MKPTSKTYIHILFCIYFAGFLLLGDVSIWLYSAMNRSLQKKAIREMIQRHEENDGYCVLRVANHDTNKNLVWEDDENEFTMNNEMYDVVSKVVTSDSTTYYCFKDTKEDILKARDKEYANQATSTTRHSRIPIQKSIDKFYNETPITIALPITQPMALFMKNHYISFISETNSPPPKAS